MPAAHDAIESFIARWSAATGSERANYQLFVGELCALLGVPRPEPAQADAGENAYCFERNVVFRHGDGSSSNGFLDCYRRGALVLEAKKLRAGSALSAKEKLIHDKGLVAVLKSLHDELDAAVLDAYGWSDNPSDEQILERLVALSVERVAEEAQGHVRWLRPEFQALQSAQTTMAGMAVSGRRFVTALRRSGYRHPRPHPRPKHRGRKLCQTRSPPSPARSRKPRRPKTTSPPGSPAVANGRPACPNCLPPSPPSTAPAGWKTDVGWGKVARWACST